MGRPSPACAASHAGSICLPPRLPRGRPARCPGRARTAQRRKRTVCGRPRDAPPPPHSPTRWRGGRRRRNEASAEANRRRRSAGGTRPHRPLPSRRYATAGTAERTEPRCGGRISVPARPRNPTPRSGSSNPGAEATAVDIRDEGPFSETYDAEDASAAPDGVRPRRGASRRGRRHAARLRRRHRLHLPLRRGDPEVLRTLRDRAATGEPARLARRHEPAARPLPRRPAPGQGPRRAGGPSLRVDGLADRHAPEAGRARRPDRDRQHVHPPLPGPGHHRAAAWTSVLSEAVAAGTAAAELHVVATFPLGDTDVPHGYLVVLSRDPLASVRRPPATDVLLAAAADLIGASLASRLLIAGLEHSNRLLGALGNMTTAMLRPGAGKQEVLDAVAAHLTDASVPEFDFNFATVYLLDERADGTAVVRMAAGAATTSTIATTEMLKDGAHPVAKRVPRWALEEERELAHDDVLVYVAWSRQAAVVGALAAGVESDRGDVISGSIPESATWTDIPVVWSDGATMAHVAALLIGEPKGPDDRRPARGQAPFTLAGEVFQSGGHADLIRIFLPFGSDQSRIAAGVLEVGYHRSYERRPDWGQIEALRAAAAQIAMAVETAGLYEDTREHSEQLELSADISRAIASSIDLDQTLRLVAQNLARLVNASLCQIALYEEDREGWFGAAASDQEDLWRRQHGERSEPSFLFNVLDHGEPVVIEDTSSNSLVSPGYARAFGVRSLLALPLVADGQSIGAAVLAERDHQRAFTPDEVQRAQGLALQAAVAIKNARLHALAEEERHLQKDFVLIGFGQWGQKAYQHLLTLKQFFNFRTLVVEHEAPGARERLAGKDEEVRQHGDAFYWDSPSEPAHEQLERELESSSYVITYIATPAATHLPTLATYY